MTSVEVRDGVFRRSLLVGALGSLVLSVALVAVVVLVLPAILPVTTSRATRATLAVVAAIVVLVLIWGSLLWLRNLRVVVTPAEVVVRRPFQDLHTWDRATTTFTAVVTEHRTNGIRSGYTRAIVAHRRDPQGGETTSKVDLPGFSRATFNALMSAVNPSVRPPAPRP